MRILGIDPGSRSAGYALIAPEGTRKKWRPLAYGVVAAQGSDTVARIGKIALCFRRLLSRYSPDLVAVEEAFYGKDVRSLLRMGEARGAILAVVCDAGLPVHQFAPAIVKRAVTGNGAATKSQVQAMVRRLLAMEAVPLDADAADACAVALCCAHRATRVGFSTGRR